MARFASHLPQMKKLELVQRILMLISSVLILHTHWTEIQKNEIQYENFNACGAFVEFHGVSVHPGSSKDTMVNASLVAMEFDSMLPKGETPRDTEGYEGFYHLLNMEGECALAKTSLHLSVIMM